MAVSNFFSGHDFAPLCLLQGRSHNTWNPIINLGLTRCVADEEDEFDF
jgi:hypothetical protein